MRHNLPVSIGFLLMFILACNLPAAVPVSAPTSIPPGPTAAPAATQLAAPTATNTSAPAPSLTPIPCNLATFVADVTIPDGTALTFNQGFTKTWRLKNVGSCSWTSGYLVVFDSGDQMGGPASQQLTNGSVPPGGTIDVSLNLHAPASAGSYQGNWKLREPGGTVFGLTTGSAFWVKIQAQAVLGALPDWPIRKNGNNGPEVTAIQYLLLAHGEDLDVDGVFGPITKSKVQHFQGQNGLDADGIVGPKTWPKLILQVQQGSHGQAVRAVQKLLNDKFGFNLAVDGIFGPDTDAAVRTYQTTHGLASDGIVGPNTWRSLVGTQ